MDRLILHFINNSVKLDQYKRLMRIIDDTQIGYAELELLLKTVFKLNDGYAYAITFDWLVKNGVELVKKNWNKSYIEHNSGCYGVHNITITQDQDFEYLYVDGCKN